MQLGSDDDQGFAEAREINVTPFIDVMLVLPIIFMAAARWPRWTWRSPLPLDQPDRRDVRIQANRVAPSYRALLSSVGLSHFCKQNADPGRDEQRCRGRAADGLGHHL